MYGREEGFIAKTYRSAIASRVYLGKCSVSFAGNSRVHHNTTDTDILTGVWRPHLRLVFVNNE